MPQSTHSLILIGYRCTGKTTIARRLADRLDVPAFDSDTEIETLSGKSIAEIFTQEGEAAFRDKEESVIAEILTRPVPFILSTGGGVILRAETRDRLRRSGSVVWLTATPETILRRMKNDTATETMRPSLTNLPMREEIVAVLEKRTPLYAETAHHIIDTDSQTTDNIVEILQRVYKRRPSFGKI